MCSPDARIGQAAGPRVAVIIPAYNEERTVASVVRCAFDSTVVHEVIVVDNGSTDRTAERAAEAGARVIVQRLRGKGEAVESGVAATSAPLILLLDGDLVGLDSSHIVALLEPVRKGDALMSCGMVDRGPFLNWLHRAAFPILTGQRAMPRDLIESIPRKHLRGYRIETALNYAVKQAGGRRQLVMCTGLTHVMKERKRDSVFLGLAAKMFMFAEVAAGYVELSLDGARH